MWIESYDLFLDEDFRLFRDNNVEIYLLFMGDIFE